MRHSVLIIVIASICMFSAPAGAQTQCDAADLACRIFELRQENRRLGSRSAQLEKEVGSLREAVVRSRKVLEDTVMHYERGITGNPSAHGQIAESGLWPVAGNQAEAKKGAGAAAARAVVVDGVFLGTFEADPDSLRVIVDSDHEPTVQVIFHPYNGSTASSILGGESLARDWFVQLRHRSRSDEHVEINFLEAEDSLLQVFPQTRPVRASWTIQSVRSRIPNTDAIFQARLGWRERGTDGAIHWGQGETTWTDVARIKLRSSPRIPWWVQWVPIIGLVGTLVGIVTGIFGKDAFVRAGHRIRGWVGRTARVEDAGIPASEDEVLVDQVPAMAAIESSPPDYPPAKTKIL